MNIAYIFGGSKLENSISSNNLLTQVGQQGNVVPDICEFVIDIRPATPDLTPKVITDHLKKYLTKNNYKLEIINLRHNLGAWFTNLNEIKPILNLATKVTNAQKPLLDNPGQGGYLDLQMLWNAVGRPPSLMFGGGKGSTAHGPDEHININNLIKTRDFFVKILNKQ